MTEVEKLEDISRNLREMSTLVLQFDRLFGQLQEIREQASLYGPFYDQGGQSRGGEISRQLLECRQEIMGRQDDLTKFLYSVSLPAEWHVSPAPALGGPIEIHNIFDAFIAITGDVDPRPNLIHMTDLLQKGNLACQRLLTKYKENPPNPLTEKMKAAPRHVGSVFSWFFPGEKQRSTLGWIFIVGFVALILRYIFGIHLEETGKLLVKWFKLDK